MSYKYTGEAAIENTYAIDELGSKTVIVKKSIANCCQSVLLFAFGNFHAFCRPLFFFKINFLKIFFQTNH